jgi:predicted membrane-bound mannosyltransferase
LILLAGVGTTVILRAVKARWYRTLVLTVLVPAVIHLAWQAYSGCYRYFDDHANPYVYAHPTSDVFRVVRKIEEAAAMHADGKKMYIEMICPGNDCWPFPWYLRQFENVGYFTEVDMTGMPAPVIIAFASLEQQVLTKIWTVPPPGKRSLYVPLFDKYTELRPTIELRGYVMNDLLEGRLRGPDQSREAKE